MARAIGIRVHKGAELIETQVFEREMIKIGRLASAHLRLEDTKVSRIHAAITVGDAALGNEVSITDMGSAEGTRVNGQRISRLALKHGDEIGLGDARLVLILDDVEVAALKGAAPATSPLPSTLAPPTGAPADNADGFSGGLSSHTAVFSSGPTDVAALRAELAASIPPAVVGTDVFSAPAGVAASFQAPKTSPLHAPLPTQASLAAASIAPISLPPTSFAPVTAPPSSVAAVTAPPSRAAVSRRAASRPGHVAGHVAEPLAAMPPLPPIPEDRITPENRFIEVTVRWGNDVMECKRVKNVEQFTIGRKDTDDIFVPLEGVCSDESFAILRADKGGGWYTRWTSKMNGSVTRGDQNRPLSQAGGVPDGEGMTAPITDDSVFEFVFNQFAIEVRPVAKSRIIPIAPIFDVLWANTAVVTLFGAIAMMAVVTLLPVGLDSMEDDLLTNPSKFQTLILKPPPKDNSFLNKLKGPKEQKQAAQNENGKAGDKKAKPEEKNKMAVKAKDKPTDEQVVASKLDALFGDKGSGGIAQLFGDTSSGGALEAALGGLDGAKVGAAYGSGGLGLRGGGPGGGGTGLNTMGTGKVGTRGRGSGEAGYGSGEGGLGNKTDRDVTMTQGTPVINGSLDKEIIRRIVQEHASQIRYCYEKELTRTPGIYGKIVMKWVIDGNGKVTQAQTAETQMKNANVEGCLATKVKTWVFPKPKGGGIVIVNYPFVFKQG